MKLILCPKGFIGTKVNRRDIEIDKLSQEERGYTIVDDSIAEELLKRDGFESVSRETYSRDFDKLYTRCKKNRQVKETTPANIHIETQKIKPCLWCRFKQWVRNKFK